MIKKYVIKDFLKQRYYCGDIHGWTTDSYLADYFDTIEDAENFICRECGQFQIETVYFI